MASNRRRTPLSGSRDDAHHCPVPDQLDAMAKVTLFNDLDDDEIVAVNAAMRVDSHPADSVIHHAGQPADRLYVVASGRVKLVRPTLSGDDVIVDLLGPGGLFGTLRQLGRHRHDVTAMAVTTTCTLQLTTDVFQRVLAEHPGMALRVLDDVASSLDQAREQLESLSTDPVAVRVARTLVMLADRFGRPRPGDAVLLQVPLTRTDLAAMTGATTESVSRVVSRWRRAGIIDTGRRWTAVLDHDRLQALADGLPEASE